MNISLLTLIVAVVYTAAFLRMFRAYDKALRKKGCKNRKTIELTLSITHTLCWFIIAILHPDYINNIVTPAVIVFIAQLDTIYSDNKATEVN